MESGIPGIDEASDCCRTGTRFGFVLEPDGGGSYSLSTTSSHLRLLQRRSVKMLSVARPFPSILI